MSPVCLAQPDKVPLWHRGTGYSVHMCIQLCLYNVKSQVRGATQRVTALEDAYRQLQTVGALHTELAGSYFCGDDFTEVECLEAGCVIHVLRHKVEYRGSSV